MQRRPNDLRSLTHKQQRSHPSSQMLADLRWWSVFLASYNGVSLIRSEPQINNSLRFCTDASLHGNSGRLIHATYPLFITSQSLHINALEMLAVTVSVKLFASVLPTHPRSNRQCNKSTKLAINPSKSRVPFTQTCLHELWLYAASYDFEISACHIAGSQDVIADWLSRLHRF